MALQTPMKAYRGPASGLPTLEAGQLGWTTDTHTLYIGTGTGNLAVLMASQATAAGLALMDDANAAAQLATLGLTATAAELNQLDNTALGTIVTHAQEDFVLSSDYLTRGDTLFKGAASISILNVGTLGQVLTVIANSDLGWASLSMVLSGTPSDHASSGLECSTYVVGEQILRMQLMYMNSDGKWWKTDADAIATMGLLAIALETHNSAGEAMLAAMPCGFVRDDSWSWTVGGILYASGTAGALTHTQPAGVDGVVRVVGYAVTAHIIWFQPDSGYITHV